MFRILHLTMRLQYKALKERKMRSHNSNPKKQKETYMFLGFGNYGGIPNPQVNAGLVRNPSMLEPLFRLLGIIEDPPAR
jgi:hypothetical protein